MTSIVELPEEIIDQIVSYVPGFRGNLSLSHPRFWNNIATNSNTRICLNSFLTNKSQVSRKYSAFKVIFDVNDGEDLIRKFDEIMETYVEQNDCVYSMNIDINNLKTTILFNVINRYQNKPTNKPTNKLSISIIGSLLRNFEYFMSNIDKYFDKSFVHKNLICQLNEIIESHLIEYCVKIYVDIFETSVSFTLRDNDHRDRSLLINGSFLKMYDRLFSILDHSFNQYLQQNDILRKLQNIMEIYVEPNYISYFVNMTAVNFVNTIKFVLKDIVK